MVKTETRTLHICGGTLSAEFTFDTSERRTIGVNKLKVKILSATGVSPKIFVWHRGATGAPMEDGTPRDEFVNVADALDIDEIPVDEPDIENGIPYYRTDELELWFRNTDMMYETADSLGNVTY